MNRLMPIDRLHYRQGFTLLEVMVALAIFAVAAIALTKAGMSYTNGVSRLREQTLAHWVAMNTAARLTIRHEWLSGHSEQQVNEQGRQWQVQLQTYDTPSPVVRRVEIKVFNADNSLDLTNSAQNPLQTLVVFIRQPVPEQP